MKKVVFVSLLLVCLLSFIVAVAEFDPVYISDFTKDENGWQPGLFFDIHHSEEGILVVSAIPEKKKEMKDSSNAGYACLSRELNDIDLTAGTEYRFSMEVFQNQEKEVLISANTGDEFGVRASNPVKVKKGEWATVYNTYYVDKDLSPTYLALYPSPYVDLQVRNVRIEPDRKTFIQGIEYDIDAHAGTRTMPEFLKLKTGDVLSDEFLDIQIKYAEKHGEENLELKLHIVPHQAGITKLGGVYWEILPQEEMPEELLGTWEISEENKDKLYYTFHPDGRVFYFWKPSSGKSSSQKMLQYAYSQGKIMFSRSWPISVKTDGMDVEDGILMPHSLLPQNLHMKGKPKHIADGKVGRIQNCTVEFYKNNKLPDTILVDPSPDASPYMALPINIEIKPEFPIDPSMVFSFSDPEIAEVSDYQAWSLSIRAKKPGTTEFTVQPDHKKGKASNTITITVLEGEKTLPDELAGVRWIGSQPQEPGAKMCVIFDRNGRYVYFEKRKDLNSLIVYAGFYLYREGVIQIGRGNEDSPFQPFCLWLYVDEADGQKVLKASNIYLTSEPLTAENEFFPVSITPAVDSGTDWNEFWAYCRYCWDHKLSLP